MRKGDGSGRAAGSAAGSGRQVRVRVRGSGSGRRGCFMQTTPLLAVESALSRSNSSSSSSSSRHDALRRRESGKETDLDGRSGISHTSILAEREGWPC
jgi:hypothetical protein